MNLATTPLSWNACLSSLRLDRWMMGELGPADAETVGTHVSACAACSAAVSTMRGVREEVRAFPLPPALVHGPPARRPVRALAAAGAGLALAASLFVVLRPSAPTGRLKGSGSGVGLAMYVQHGAEVRRAAPGESVAPGDAVRFAVSTPSPAFVAVLSLDAAGKAWVYFPEGPRAARIPAGTEVPLPLGTRLDATVGEERLLALFCTSPVELEPVRLALQQAQDAAPLPADCQGLRWSFVKR